MRRTPYLLIVVTLLLVGLSLQSCSRDPEEEEKKGQEDKEVKDWESEDINGDATMAPMLMQFNVLNAGTLSDPDAGTRGSVGTATTDHYTFDVDDLVTINITGKGKKVYKITEVTTDETTHVSTGTLSYTPSTSGFYWEGKETLDLTAWSYGSATEMSNDPHGQTFILETNQEGNGYQELLYTSPVDTYSYGTDGIIGLKLYHQLARLVINISYDLGNSLDDIFIGDGLTAVIPTTGKFNRPATGKTTGTWPEENMGTEHGKIIPKTETANTCYSAVLIPTTYTENTKFIVINMDDDTFAYTLDGDIELQAGKQYTFSLTVKNGLILNGITIDTGFTTGSNPTISQNP